MYEGCCSEKDIRRLLKKPEMISRHIHGNFPALLRPDRRLRKRKENMHEAIEIHLRERISGKRSEKCSAFTRSGKKYPLLALEKIFTARSAGEAECNRDPPVDPSHAGCNGPADQRGYLTGGRISSGKRRIGGVVQSRPVSCPAVPLFPHIPDPVRNKTQKSWNLPGTIQDSPAGK